MVADWLLLLGCVCCIISAIVFADQPPELPLRLAIREPLAFLIAGLALIGVSWLL